MRVIALIQTADSGGTVAFLIQILPIAAIFLLLYLFVIAPANRRRQKTQGMLSTLKKDDRVLLPNLLPPNEQVLLGSPGGGLILTTHRVRYEEQGGGGGTFISIMLDEIASCTVIRVQHPILLVIAAISVLLGVAIWIVDSRPDGAVVGIIIGLVLIGIYFATRQQVLALASAGATIRVNTIGMKADVVTDFVDQVEFAKNSRYLVRPSAV